MKFASYTPRDPRVHHPEKRREWPTYCRCDLCHDLVTIVFWVRRDGRGSHEALLEQSTEAKIIDDLLTHRPGHCGGRLQLLEPLPYKTTLAG